METPRSVRRSPSRGSVEAVAVEPMRGGIVPRSGELVKVRNSTGDKMVKRLRGLRLGPANLAICRPWAAGGDQRLEKMKCLAGRVGGQVTVAT